MNIDEVYQNNRAIKTDRKIALWSSLDAFEGKEKSSSSNKSALHRFMVIYDADMHLK